MSLLLSWSAVSSKSVKNSIVNLSPSNWTILYKWTKKYFLHLLFDGLDDLVALKSLMQMNAEEVDNNDVCVDAGWWQGWPSEDRRLICVTIRVSAEVRPRITLINSHILARLTTLSLRVILLQPDWQLIRFCIFRNPVGSDYLKKKRADFCIWILNSLLSFNVSDQESSKWIYSIHLVWKVCCLSRGKSKIASVGRVAACHLSFPRSA